MNVRSGDYETIREAKGRFLSICGQYDYDLLTGKNKMTQADFERITHITLSLGYTAYTQTLISTYLDLACKEVEQIDREHDILADYPEYYEDEQILEQTSQWIEDFLNQIPTEKQSYYRQLIKENTHDFNGQVIARSGI